MGQTQRTRVTYGVFLRRTTIFFAERRRACGSTMRFRSFSGLKSGLARTPPIFTGKRFQTSSPQKPSGRARFSTAFGMEVIATTDSALDSLDAHAAIRSSGWKGRVIPTFRPDAVVDPEFAGFRGNLKKLAAITGEDTGTWRGYLAALIARRRFFKQQGATATDHGHPTAATVNLSRSEVEALFIRVTRMEEVKPADAELFRAQMLSEMARMSVEDGLVMQLHVGSFRNYNPVLFAKWGRDQGADIPTPTDYVHALHPLLARYGNEPDFRLILFTIDESTFSRELAPLAGTLSLGDSGAAMVVPRQPGGNAALPPTRNRDCGFLQHRRIQRRHACVSLDPRSA